MVALRSHSWVVDSVLHHNQSPAVDSALLRSLVETLRSLVVPALHHTRNSAVGSALLRIAADTALLHTHSSAAVRPWSQDLAAIQR